jgi:TonB family protein
VIPQLVLDNFRPWVTQVLLIGSIGALLPAVFRIRHPRSQLVYCHLLLATCLLLPLLQPWHHPIVVVSVTDASALPPATGSAAISFTSRNLQWAPLILWLIIAGAVFRLCWTALGLWRIRRHKLAATPLYPVPETIKDAMRRVRTNATFCISSSGIGPVTFGFLRPVVLLPASFLKLESRAQCGIACHELLHVKRHDWLITVIEEVVAAAFWFQPAFWWLLGQARLSREQLVDAEVVRVITEREPYINALLAIAGAQRGLDLAPAPLFLRRRHLLQRMHLLVTEVPMSRLRLLSSYTSMFAILAAGAWLGVVSFPLVGRAEIRKAAAPAPATVATPQNSPGYVVNIQPLRYPLEAMQKRIEGTVVVELTFNAAGNIVDSRVLSGPEELRAAALESALKGSYSINVARTLQVLVDFKLGEGKFIQAPPPPPPPQGASMNLIVDHIDIRGLSEPQLSDLRQRLNALVGKPFTPGQVQKAVREAGLPNLIAIQEHKVNEDKVSIELAFSSEPRVVQTPFGPAIVGGTIQTPFGPIANPRVTAGTDSNGSPDPTDAAPFVPDLQPLSKIDPVYPPLARQARIQGVVVMRVLINGAGKIENVRVVTGHPLLIQAAIDAVKQWVYPTQSSPVATNVTLNFAFPQ